MVFSFFSSSTRIFNVQWSFHIVSLTACIHLKIFTLIKCKCSSTHTLASSSLWSMPRRSLEWFARKARRSAAKSPVSTSYSATVPSRADRLGPFCIFRRHVSQMLGLVVNGLLGRCRRHLLHWGLSRQMEHRPLSQATWQFLHTVIQISFLSVGFSRWF